MLVYSWKWCNLAGAESRWEKDGWNKVGKLLENPGKP